MQVRFHELNLADAKTACSRRAHDKRRPREIGRNDDTIGAGEIERHLSRPAADLSDPRVARNGAIEELREAAPFGASSERRKTVAGRVARERGGIIEAAHRFDPRMAVQPEIWNAVRRVEARAARGAAPG